MVILPPDNPKNNTAVNNLRPDGNFGIQIAIADRSLWLSGITTTDADIFRTPEDVRLGLPVGQMVKQLIGKEFNATLFPKDVLESVKVDRLELRRSRLTSQSPKSTQLTFGLEVSVSYGESELRLWLIVSTNEQKLQIRLGDSHNPSIEIDVTLSSDGFFAHLEQSNAPKSFKLAPLGRVLSPDLEELMGAIEITPLEFAIGSHKASGNYVLALKLGVDIALSQLPFVGERLPKGADVSISELSLVWCSSTLATNKDARDYFVEKYGDKSTDPDKKCELITSEALSSGGIFSASLKVPSVESKHQLSLLFASPTKSATPDPPPEDNKKTTSSSSDDSAKWFKVGKNVGPLSLQRIGMKYEGKKIWFLFDASLNSGSLALIVDGLGAGLDPFKLLGGHFEPAFTLRGLGLDIKGPAEVSGSLMRDRVKDPRGDYDEFSGAILIKNKTFAIAGMASYADPSWSDPTFFAYAFLDKTIGGPPCFFVTGLTIGIAINRSLDLPPIDQISQFPLVRMALGDPPAPPGSDLPTVRDTKGDSELAKLLALQQAMRPYTRPHSGQIVLAVGVRFTTFKLLNSFALLVASFGKPFKLDLLISSRLEIPALPPESKVPRIAQIGIDLRGTWIPEDGTIFVEGRIAEGSWFLDSACRLTGGAAFAAWTSGPHAGDFVMTVGGYHPKFTVPAHYPKVPRLALNFTRGAMEIKGDAYFAMTPAALMAGISLNATFTEGNFKAWFNCEADFLVAWEPFSYEATMNVEIGASYKTFLGTVRGSVGAKLQLWGPDMAGIATVDLTVIKYDVKFGGDKTLPKPIDAKAFRERFLPANDAELLSIGVSKGLVSSGTYEGVPLFVVNPADFSLAIESQIPKPDGKSIGIGPMGKTALPIAEILKWEIDKDKSNFREELISKPLPSALWGLAPREGEVRSPDFQSKGTVDAVVGYTIKPKIASTSPPPDPKIFKVQSQKATAQQSWPSDSPPFAKNTNTVESILNKISQNPPEELLAALTGKAARDLVAENSLSTYWLANLQELPHVGTLLRSAS